MCNRDSESWKVGQDGGKEGGHKLGRKKLCTEKRILNKWGLFTGE